MTPPPIKQIRFSEIMIRALLREIEKPGTGKTQERLVLKLPTKGEYFLRGGWEPTTSGGAGVFYSDGRAAPEQVAIWNQTTGTTVVVPHQVGDLLWVQETWQGINTPDGPQLTYRATPDYFEIDAWDGPDEGAGPSFNYDRCPGTDFCNWGADVLNDDGPWRPSIHMPRWASRLTLEVTGVKVERLQDISKEDAIAEGIEPDQSGRFTTIAWRNYDYPNYPINSAVLSFRSLWNSINEARGSGWDANPWAAAITFRPHKANVETLLSQREAA